MPNDTEDHPLRQADSITIYYNDSVGGAEKTRTAVITAIKAAENEGRKTIIAMPTIALIKEVMDKYAVEIAYERGIPIYAIYGEDEDSPKRKKQSGIDHRVRNRIYNFLRRPRLGSVLFITHQGFEYVDSFPTQSKEYEFIYDEVPSIVLNRRPIKLSDSGSLVFDFLEGHPLKITLSEREFPRPPEFTTRPKINGREVGKIDDPTIYDSDRLNTYKLLLKDSATPKNNKEMATSLIQKLQAKKKEWNSWKKLTSYNPATETMYYYIKPNPRYARNGDPLWAVKLREEKKESDEVFKLIDPIPLWIMQGAAIFVRATAWEGTVLRNPSFPKSAISVQGFRRPERLKAFSKVTILGALLKDSLTYQIWEKLGVNFERSPEINMDIPVTYLGNRTLKLYSLYDEGWSKHARDSSGGIGIILDYIQKRNIIDMNDTLCVVVNKDDGSPSDQRIVQAVFPNGIVIPHNSKGQNKYMEHRQLLYCAALNPHTPDIRWLEDVFGIDSGKQRIARTAQEFYQTLMRLQLRNPHGEAKVIIGIAFDKDVVDWTARHFQPDNQVEVYDLDSSGIIRKRRRTAEPLKPGIPLHPNTRKVKV